MCYIRTAIIDVAGFCIMHVWSLAHFRQAPPHHCAGFLGLTGLTIGLFGVAAMNKSELNWAKQEVTNFTPLGTTNNHRGCNRLIKFFGI